MQINDGFSVVNLTSFKDKIGVSMPIESLEDFKQFNNKLENDADLQKDVVSKISNYISYNFEH